MFSRHGAGTLLPGIGPGEEFIDLAHGPAITGSFEGQAVLSAGPAEPVFEQVVADKPAKGVRALALAVAVDLGNRKLGVVIRIDCGTPPK